MFLIFTVIKSNRINAEDAKLGFRKMKFSD